MFDGLSKRLRGIFDAIGKRGVLSEKDIDEALRLVRRALIEADVALDTVREFIAKVQKRALGREVLRSVTPGQMMIKIIHDILIETLGETSENIDLNAAAPVVVLMVGLQGAGKTTTTAKLARLLETKHGRRVMMASLDINRPAAQEQLKILGDQIAINTLPIVKGQTPLQISARGINAAKLSGYDVLLLDSAGRTHINDGLMQEMVAIKAATGAHETLLVADALTGQDAVNVASAFDRKVGITGLILTRVDGDGRGGAALSMRAITGKPIKLIGVGEKIDDLEPFHPERIAKRILGMGDIVSLVEKVSLTVDKEKSQAIANKMQQGTFDLNDLGEQLRQMAKLGSISGIMALLPGVAKAKKQFANANIDDKMFRRQEAVIMSMTPYERSHPRVLNGSRKRRISAGAGVGVPEVNRLLKMHRQMADFLKKAGKGKGGFGSQMAALGGLGGARMTDSDLFGAETNLTGIPDLSRMSGLSGSELPPGLSAMNLTKGLPQGKRFTKRAKK